MPFPESQLWIPIREVQRRLEAILGQPVHYNTVRRWIHHGWVDAHNAGATSRYDVYWPSVEAYLAAPKSRGKPLAQAGSEETSVEVFPPSVRKA